MKSYIIESVNLMKSEYKKNPKRIKSDYNREREAIDVYRGREILELIQNADDELLDGMDKIIKISFLDNILTISNNGSPFNEEGIDSLMYSNNSSKYKKKDVIGNKGTGFRSILGWAKEIRINSGKLNIRFSEEYAQRVLEDMIIEVNNINKNDYHAATLVFPEWLDSRVDSGFTTDISIYVHNEERIIKDINKQLEDIDEELLLFLNRTEELVIQIDEKVVHFQKKNINEETIIIQKYINNILVGKQEYFLNRFEGEFEERNFTIVIAYNEEGVKHKRQVLYSYFPTDVEFPFPVLLHSNFNLNSDRNHLTKNDNANRYILEQACNLLINTALKLTENEVSYSPLLILAAQRPISKELSDYGFQEILLEKIKYSKLFPTVNCEYIEFIKNPKFYTSELSLYLNGEEFEDLLINTENPEIFSLIKKLNNGKFPRYTFDEIVEKINKWSKNHVAEDEIIEKHIHCVNGFLKEYSNELKNNNRTPTLIYDTDGILVSNETAIFLRDKNANITPPPNFAQIKFMHPSMRLLFEKLIWVGGRNLATKLSAFEVKEYNTARIIEKMNSVIKKNLDKGNTEKAKKFCLLELKWVWENIHLLETRERYKIYMVTSDGEVRLSDELYIGKEYGNYICENLFNGLYSNKFVADIRKYIDINETLNQDLIYFLQMLGLDLYPKKKIKKIKVELDYKRKIFGELHFPYNFEDAVFKDINNMLSRVYSTTAEVTVIDEIDNILTNTPTQNIIEWLRVDTSLSEILYSKKENGKNKLQLVWDQKQNYRSLPIDNIYSYIYWKFETFAWIDIEKKRYTISDCILNKIGSVLEPILVEPEIDNYISNINGNKTKIKNEYEYILGRIGVSLDFSELPIYKIYEVLNILHKVKNCEAIAKRFYASLIKSDRLITDNELQCQSYKEFIESGKVLCNNGFQFIHEAWYLDGKNICEKIANTYNLIEIAKRQNSGKIKRLLGVNKLVLNGEVVGEPKIHNQNSIFQRDLKLFKPMAFCYRIDNASKDEVNKFKNLDIILCTKLSAKYTGRVIELDDYDFILKDNRTFYLKVPISINSLEDMKQSVAFGAAIANVLCSYIDVTESFASFRELYGANENSRTELIKQVFEDEEIINRAKFALNYFEDTKNEFIKIVKKCTGYEYQEIEKAAQDIDFENISAIYNAKPIIVCFNYLGIDIENYNSEFPSTPIDLSSYYQKEISSLRLKYEGFYKINNYNKLMKFGLKEKKKLVDIFLKYENINVEIENSIHFDSEKALIASLGIDIEQEFIDLSVMYKNNLANWKTNIKNSDYLDEFLKIPSNMSLLYFGEYEELTRIYNDYISLQVSFEKEFDNDDNDIIPEILFPDTNPVNATNNSGGSGNGYTGYNGQRNLERIGLKGEKIVYDFLKKQNPTTKWVSENAKVMEVTPEGRAGLGYDIEYIDDNGNRIYIEVKSSKNDGIVFYLSDNEFNFAQKHASYYKIYYVSEVLTKQPKILVLDNIFNEYGFNYERYSIGIKKEFRIAAEYKVPALII